MSSGKTCRPVPGLSREAEEKELEKIIGIAQENLTKTEAYIRQLTDELDDLMEVYGTKDKEAMVLFHNTHSQIQEHKRALLRCQKARRKPYFGRILKIQSSRRQSLTMWGGSALRIRTRSRL